MSPVTSLTTLLLALGVVACATDPTATTPETRSINAAPDDTDPCGPSSPGCGPSSDPCGDGGTLCDFSSCQAVLDQIPALCYPTAKHYTPEESAACVASQQQQYENCKLTVECTKIYDDAVAACGKKPKQGTPKYDKYNACVAKAVFDLGICAAPINGDAP